MTARGIPWSELPCAAALTAVVAAFAGPGGLLPAAAAAALAAALLGPRVAGLLVFAAAAWLLAMRAMPRPPAATSPFRAQVEAVVAAPCLETGTTAPRRVRMDPGPELGWFWLREPASHPPRQRGERLRLSGWFFPGTVTGRRPRPGVLEVRAPEQVEVLEGTAGGPWLRCQRGLDGLRAAIAARLRETLSEAAFPWLAALLLGESGLLPREVRSTLQNSGTYHLIAVSGMHVVIVGGLALFLARRLPPPLPLLTALAAVAGFAGLAGARPPVLRAALLFAAWGWRTVRRRPSSSVPAVSATFLLFAALDPDSLQDVGLHLSFVAVLGLCAAGSYGLALSPRGTGRGLAWWRPAARGLWLSVGATLATAPWTAFHFGTWTPWSPLFHLVLAPALPLLLLGGILLALLGPCEWLSPPCAALLHLLCRALEWLARWFDGAPGTPLHVVPPAPAALAGWMLCLWWLGRRRPGLALAVLLAGGLVGRPAPGPPHAVRVLDVGHGLAVLVQHGERVDLLDAGALDATPASFESFARALRGAGIRRLDGLFLSHLDADHMAFALPLLHAVRVERVFLSAAHENEWDQAASSGVRDLREGVERRGVPVQFLAQGDRVGPHEVLWPPRGRAFLADNEGSLVLHSRLGRETLLHCGDLCSYPLADLTRQQRLRATVLVLPHHGNPDPFLPGFLDSCRPLVAIASRSAPLEAEVEAALRGSGVSPFVTGRDGAAVLPWSDCADLTQLPRNVLGGSPPAAPTLP